jgi:decaprenyl-phosphate phosphoribosyltransferase
MSFSTISQLLRFRHYIKNVVVFMPAFFAGTITDDGALLDLLWVFVSFCLTASAVYIMNDVRDRDFDKLHARKSKRPIASGKVKPKPALFLGAILLAIGLGIAFWSSQTIGLLVLSYFVINILYTFFLKNVALVDLAFIAGGFILRVFSGGECSQVEVSSWLVIMLFLMSLFMGLAKRREDALLLEEKDIETRLNAKSYDLRFVDAAMSVIASVIIVAYILYSVSPEVELRTSSEYVYITSFLVVFGMLRYMHLAIAQKKGGSPIEALMKDRFLQVVVVSWAIMFYCLLYVTW